MNPLIKRMTMTLPLAAGLLWGGQALAADAADYSDSDNWLCHAADGGLGACDIDLTTTVVAANGDLSVEQYKADADAPVDCFYVYPTVSLDKTPNSDLEAGPEEYSVIKQQFARFGSVCKTYAPLYRQVTLTALRAGLGGGEPMQVDRALGYNDVVNAWNHYLENDNDGRGVVLVGHSQGSGVLTRLIQEKIEGQDIESQIISAMLIGTNVQVPQGKVVGGSFKKMPLCTAADQTACIVTYASFRSTVQPPENSLFGRGGSDTVSACVNPAQLANDTNTLHAYLNTQGSVSSSSVAPLPWTKDTPELDTPFASVPGLLTGECVQNDRGSYFEITVHGDPSDPRTDDIAGDVISNGEVNAGWGLHLIDVNLAIGDLIDLAAKQAAAWQE